MAYPNCGEPIERERSIRRPGGGRSDPFDPTNGNRTRNHVAPTEPPDSPFTIQMSTRFTGLRTEVLQVRRVPTVTVAVSAVTAVLWLAIVGGWLPMPGSGGMSVPTSDPGVPEMMGTGNGLSGVLLYLLLWGVMMSAMMYPAMIPTVRRRVAAVDGSALLKVRDAVAFLGAYSVVWTATGLVPLAVDSVVPLASLAADHRSLLLGVAFVGAGVYQLSARKARSLIRCCERVPGESSPDLRRAARSGVRHGLSCVDCTWALFALMVVVGSMNAFWMLLLTMVVTVERFVAWNDEARITIGALAIAGGVAVLAFGAPPV